MGFFIFRKKGSFFLPRVMGTKFRDDRQSNGKDNGKLPWKLGRIPESEGLNVGIQNSSDEVWGIFRV